MNKNFEIVEYEDKYKKQVLELFNEFGNYFKEIDNLKRLIVKKGYSQYFLSNMIKDVENFSGKIFLAKIDKKIVGFISGNIKKDKAHDTFETKTYKKAKILEFFVKEDFRNIGIGKLLLNKLEKYFESKNCNQINVEVFTPNINTYKFYKNLGFLDRNIDMIKIIK